jgi:uncharacterized protein
MIRAVIDTNIIVSGLLWGGLPGQVFQAARDELFVTVLTKPLHSETMRVLARSKFAEQIAVRQIRIDVLGEQYRATSEWLKLPMFHLVLYATPKMRWCYPALLVAKLTILFRVIRIC